MNELSDIDMATLREGVESGLDGLDDEMCDSMGFTQEALTDAWAFVRKALDLSELDNDAMSIVEQSWIVGAESATYIDDKTFERIAAAIAQDSTYSYS